MGYPTIDFTKCNIRSITNITKPQKFAVLGCSADTEFPTATTKHLEVFIRVFALMEQSTGIEHS